MLVTSLNTKIGYYKAAEIAQQAHKEGRIAFTALTLFFIIRALQSELRSPDSLKSWAWAGVMLGLAFWSKYTSILLPLGVLVACPPNTLEVVTSVDWSMM